MSGKTYGYIRVSSKEQHIERQLVALQQCGVESNCIFVDKNSGKDFVRDNYQLLLRTIKPGDTIVVKSIDRLGRNYDEILYQWHHITRELDTDIVVLDMPLLDTRAGKDLTGTLISDIVLQLLSYVAQTEREFIRQRQAEGIVVAKERGVHFGRKPKEKPCNYEIVKERWKNGSISAREAARQLGTTHKTFLFWARNDNG